MSIHRHPPGLCLLGLGVIAACGATLPVDNSIYFPSMPVSTDGCQPAVDRIPSVDEATPLGFTALDALTRLAGPRSSELDWLEPAPSDEYQLEYGPERGRSTLDLDVRIAEGPILYRYRVPTYGVSDGAECDAGALEIPVEVTLRSGGQALDERFEATLEASAPYHGHLRTTFLPTALDGGLSFDRVTSLDPERSFVLGALTLDAVLWPGGSMGSLGIQVAARSAHPPSDAEAFGPLPAAAGQPRDVATWPSAQECPGGARALPIDAAVLGFSAADVLERLARGGPRQLTRADGTTTAVNVELAQVVDQEICQDVTDRLSFGVTLRAKSEDGRLDDVMLVQVEAVGDDGDIGDISLASDDPSSVPEVEMPAAQLGAGANGDAERAEPGDVTIVE